MCNAKPGKRCSTHAKAKLASTQEIAQLSQEALKDQMLATWKDEHHPAYGAEEPSFQELLTKYPHNRERLVQSQAALQRAITLYYETPEGRNEGLKELKVLKSEIPQNTAAINEVKRNLQTAQIQSGLRDVVTARLNRVTEMVSNTPLDQNDQKAYESKLTEMIQGDDVTPPDEKVARQRLVPEETRLHNARVVLRRQLLESSKQLDDDIAQGYVNSEELNRWHRATAALDSISKREALINHKVKEVVLSH